MRRPVSRDPRRDSPVHAVHPRLLGGSWRILAREYSDPALFAVSHRLTVDAYAVQHPGDPLDRRARQSVWMHFASLHAIFSGGATHDAARALLQRLSGHAFAELPRMPVMPVTVADVIAADVGDHSAAIECWARAAHAAWLPLLGAAVARL